MLQPIKILCDATLPDLNTLFKPPFELSMYNNQQQMLEQMTLNEVLICRSTLQVDKNLLENTTISCVATASSGIDHIDTDYLKQHNITVFDAKGSNADAVADYVVATIAALTSIRKRPGNKAGIIGMGEVGSRVAKRLLAMGFTVQCYDPIKAQLNSDFESCTVNDIINCDLICIHPNLHKVPPFSSYQLINTLFLDQLKSGVTIINAARGGVIDEQALLATNKPVTYCTDVYCNEPSIDPLIIDFATLCTPHIAGHTIEAKTSAIVQLSQQLYSYYGLTHPITSYSVYAGLADNRPCLHNDNAYQEQLLSLYNPLTDTVFLKEAVDKKQAFLTARKAHRRHQLRR